MDSANKAMITLDISSIPMTKATEEATVQESEIHSLRVYAYSGNQQVGYCFKSLPAPVTSFSLAMDLMIVESDDAQDVDLYVIANEASMSIDPSSPALSERMYESDLWNIRYTAIDSSEGLPMYYTGTHSIALSGGVPLVPGSNTDMSGHEGHEIYQKLEVSLIRPVAKIEVYAAKESAFSALAVSNVQLSNPAVLGYVLPPASLAGITLSTTPLSILSTSTNVTKVLDPTTLGVDLSDHANYQQIGSTYYLLENPDGSDVWNVQNSVRGSTLSFMYTEDGNAEQGIAYLPPILRNRSYKICCLIRSDREVIVRFEVSDWIDEIVNLPEYN